MKYRWLSSIVFLLVVVHAAFGVVPQKIELQNFEDYLKGKVDGLSLSYEGILTLSPREEKVTGPAEEFFLSILPLSDGDLYLGTGHSGKIYRIGKDGKAEIYFQVPEMDILCMVLDPKGNLYAGTSPNGKIYKITAKGKGDVFFNPQEKYIWDLLFNNEDHLLAAVGENGGIYEINSQGEGSMILKAEENHILCIKTDRNGDLLAGSGGKGLVYRISPGNKAAVLFESAYEEIKSIALDGSGNIYAAAGGALVKPVKDEIASVSFKTETEVTVTASASQAPVQKVFPAAGEQPGTLFRISPEGIAKKLWESDDELIYTLLWDDAEKRLLFGTGNHGRIYVLDRDDKISLLLQKDSEQVYQMISPEAKIYVLANNPSDLSLLFPEQRFSGEYLSQVYDTKTLSSWGRIVWEADSPSGTVLQFQTRSGNSRLPNLSWSVWSPPYQKKDGEQILSPKAQYIQFKTNFKTQSGKVSPRLARMSLFYLQTNIAPSLTKLELFPPNQVFLKPPEQEEIIWGADVSASGEGKADEKVKNLLLAKKVQRKGFQTVIWEAEDENQDALLYTISIRKEEERKWRVLKENWPDKIFAFDTLSYPDGVYYVKVEASDASTNPPGKELKKEKISRSLVIDNSLPVIQNFQAVRNKNVLSVSFVAEDAFSPIKEVLFLIKPDEWKSIFPEDGICDSKRESFKIDIPLSPNADDLITVKVVDSQDNTGVQRASF